MSFESPDMAKEFPGLYGNQGATTEEGFEEEDRPARRKDVLVRRKDPRPERRGKGYRMFEEENSEEELVSEDTTKSPSKMKKHSKPSFKFAKREKFYKPKEKDRDREVVGHHLPFREHPSSDKERGDAGSAKETKKKEDTGKLKWKKRKLLGPGVTSNLTKPEQRGEHAVPTDLKPIFGVPLSVAVERSKCHDGIQLPVIFRECVDFIEEHGLSCEGIYRISGVKSKVQALKDQYNQNVSVYLHEHEPNIIASLLKLYLRELPEPVLTKELLPKFEEASTVKNVKQKVEMFQQVIEELPVPNKFLLSWMISHMTHVISKEKQNKMSLQNVSIVLSPTMQISHRVLNVLFTYSRILFKDTVIKKYVPPLKPVTSRWSLDLPESPSALEEELRKQESLLTQLHEDLIKGKNSDKEELLWEVQRVVTQLKRKIKTMKKTQERAELREKEITQQKQLQQQKSDQLKSGLPDGEELNLQLQKVKPEEPATQQQQPEDSAKKEAPSGDRPTVKPPQPSPEPVRPAEEHPETPAEKQETSDAKTVEDVDLKKGEQPVESVVQEKTGDSQTADRPPVDGTTDLPPPADKPPDHTPQVEPPVQTDYQPDSSSEDEAHYQEVHTEVRAEVYTVSADSEELEKAAEDQESHSTEEQPISVPIPSSETEPRPQPSSETEPRPQPSPDTEPRPQPSPETEPTPQPSPMSSSSVSPVSSSPVSSVSSSPVVLPSSEQPEDTEGAEEEQKTPTASSQEDEGAESSTSSDFVPPSPDADDTLPSSPDMDVEADEEALQQQYSELLLEEEELLAMGDELQQKIETEQSEIERLHQEIVELKAIREDLYDSDDASSDSSIEDADEEDMKEILQDLVDKNSKLEEENQDLSGNIQEERQICLNVKVQIRMIQQRQLESSGGMLLMDGISEREALIQSLL